MKYLSILSIVLIEFFSSLLAQNQSDVDQKILFQAQKFKYILETSYNNALDSFDIEKVSEQAFNAMLKELDPFSSYFPAEKQKNVDERNKGSQESIGIDVISLNDTIVIISILPGSPADSSGLLTTDKILFVNGEIAIGKSREDILKKLTGDKGSKLSLIIKRGYGPTLQEFVLERRDVPIKSIDSYFILPATKIAYIKCNRISEQTHSEILMDLNELKKSGMKNLILDLRGNAGGQLEETCKIADEFISGAKRITFTKARGQSFIYEYISKDGNKFEDIPLIVLIDQNSASGSEVIAGVIQDYDRGIVVGEQSFGKGLAQSQWKMSDGSGFRLTVAAYHTPSGRNIQKPYKSGEIPQLDPSIQFQTSYDVIKGLEDALKKTGGHTKMPVFYTEKKRPVIGGGGIYPDFYEKKDTNTLLYRVLQSKGVFAESAINFLIKNRNEIQSEYKNDFRKFAVDFELPESILIDFKNYAFAKNTWNDQMFAQDINIIKQFLKANIAYFLWGNNGLDCVMAKFDKPILKAVQLIPEAEKMIN